MSYEVPSFHGSFCIPTRLGQNIHSAGFTDAAGSIEAYEKAIGVGKGMAAVGFKVLSDVGFADKVWQDFQTDIVKK